MSLRDALQAIYDEHHMLTPELVLDYAKPVDSPLHSQFEWDDTDAAAQWRLYQARRIIQKVKVSRLTETGPKSVRQYRSTFEGTSPRPVYQTVEDIMSDDFKRQLLLRTMEREWRTLRQKYEEMAEFWDMIRGEVA